MGMYKEAAELLFKRQCWTYGVEKIMCLAKDSGYVIDSSGEVLSVKNEEEAFNKLCSKIETELGPAAVLGSKVVLLRFLSQKKDKAFMQWVFGWAT